MAVMALLVLLASAISAFAVVHGSTISRSVSYLWYATFSYVVALTIEIDRKSRKLSAPFEYSAFVFVAWPFVVPYYMYQIKGWRGVLLGLGLIAFSSIPDLVTLATYFLLPE
jgi:hypothetical protein